MRAEALSYADVVNYHIELEAGKAEVEVPVKVLREAGVARNLEGEVEVDVSEEPGDLAPWDVALAGEVYLLQEAQGKLYASAGGLRIVLPLSALPKSVSVGSKIYLKLKFPR